VKPKSGDLGPDSSAAALLPHSLHLGFTYQYPLNSTQPQLYSSLRPNQQPYPPFSTIPRSALLVLGWTCDRTTCFACTPDSPIATTSNNLDCLPDLATYLLTYYATHRQVGFPSASSRQLSCRPGTRRLQRLPTESRREQTGRHVLQYCAPASPGCHRRQGSGFLLELPKRVVPGRTRGTWVPEMPRRDNRDRKCCPSCELGDRSHSNVCSDYPR
jgi:hypothetical protein